MRKEKKIKIGFTIGDLNGVGGELIIKTFEDKRLLDFFTPVVYASMKSMSFLKQHFQSSILFNEIPNANKAIDGKLNILNVWEEQVAIVFGKETAEAGQYALRSLKAAVEGLKTDQIQVLVTAPINKHNIQSMHFSFQGIPIF